MFAEEQIVQVHVALKISFAHVVDIHAAAFDVFSRLALRGGEAAVDEEVDDRGAGTLELGALEVLRGDLAGDHLAE